MNSVKHCALFLNAIMNDKCFPCLKTEITPSVCVAMFTAMNHLVGYVCTLFAVLILDFKDMHIIRTIYKAR
jgi:hypothetical protein